ncbi:SPOR domain-containing protein [Janthinobacterium psychrotolerans]|uniref:DedD protein n=1 Tax=Janthinobacterium psychrotolerans TaxID=1747903 RepID=A0A1A7BV77_9BURK|nr:SPOR domain-containing protein [Janthinobacterium psychrotolerans]OBV36669.1 DedD protein [Janthinobacterium psychrotolerans]
MGLFSKLFKNKQESSGEDSGFYVPGEAQSATRKRAANTAGGGRRGGREAPDPALPEKKRARRRLIGAIALALGVAVGLPMLLDSEPKSPVGDIAIDIPSKEKVAAAPVPVPAPVQAVPAQGAANNGLDQSEEIVDTPLPAKTRPVPMPTPVPATVVATAEPVKPAYVEPKPVKVEPKPEPRVEPRHETKPEPKREPKVETRHEAKPEPKPEPKPVKVEKSNDDAARALAILEGKPAARAEAKPAAKTEEKSSGGEGGKFVVQVAALATQDKVDELQAKLRDAGISSYTQKVSSPGGQRIRVRVGPFGSRDEAEKTRARLQKIGLGGSLVPA